MLIHTPAQLRAMVRRARERGFRLEVHAIGDRAAECVLDALDADAADAADASCGGTSGGGSSGSAAGGDRPVLTHCQVLGPDLVARLARQGVVANVQPSFVPTDMRWVEARVESRRRRAYSYCWKTLLWAGVVVA